MIKAFSCRNCYIFPNKSFKYVQNYDLCLAPWDRGTHLFGSPPPFSLGPFWEVGASPASGAGFYELGLYISLEHSYVFRLNSCLKWVSSSSLPHSYPEWWLNQVFHAAGRTSSPAHYLLRPVLWDIVWAFDSACLSQWSLPEPRRGLGRGCGPQVSGHLHSQEP